MKNERTSKPKQKHAPRLDALYMYRAIVVMHHLPGPKRDRELKRIDKKIASLKDPTDARD